jgi:hypothetical protein
VKKIYAAIAVVLTALCMMAAPAFAANDGHGDSSSTTLDACGYFVGTQTASSIHEKTIDGVLTTIEKGTWTGVDNVFGGGGPVASLGTVKGSYTEVTYTDANGTVIGTESFNSGAGKIEQTFMIGSAVPGTYSVTVTATRDLAFLTSDTTPGGCYSGPVPRP